MSLPQSLRTTVTPPELELIASEQLVEIIPLVSMERTAFISGAYGPLRPPNKCKIPLWMALNLKLKKKCHIVPPDWLNVDDLQAILNKETASNAYSEVPFRYVEIAKVLLDVASEDMPQPDKIRYLLKDLREARQAKCRDALALINHSDVKMTNLSSMELNEVRPVFVQSMNIWTKLVRDPTENYIGEVEEDERVS
ncbi:Psf2-domain-containing protein [Athelia psychrophila]|uniref:DNA replication complex GINS protein PSF2 n=1 Tax=Athelia psychrophila TaxID=1759441 RepID=A0A165WLR9_9AGAM|nr:Psf2-domain-containing protein [Fibularhizoctonia sp. CBS 109695]KZP20210.1 Psf2-domain-containing protein [Fibularhizoctonia sp. CBS 109695]